MKKWFILILALLLLLTGCSKEEAPIDRPPSLEVTYGESAVYANTTQYQWYWKKGRETQTAMIDAAEMGITVDKLPYVAASQGTALQLRFSQEPDKILVQAYSANDNYTSGQQLELVSNSIPAPVDGGDHLISVSAVWLEGGGKNWGSCTYQFQFLASGPVITEPIEMEIASDLSVGELIQLDGSQLLGVEFLNNYQGTTKTCRSGVDKDAIMQFLRDHLVTEPRPMMSQVPVTEYMLRLVTLTGSQVTVAYGGTATTPCLTVGGVSYEVGAMDMGALWDAVAAGAISQEAVETGKNYLDMSETFPGESWSGQSTYGYIRSMDGQLVYDEMRWLEDASAPNGYVLENGWAGQTAAISSDCEYWILENHATPYCRVTAEDLWQWTQNAGFDVLYRIYTTENQVTAICQQYQP